MTTSTFPDRILPPGAEGESLPPIDGGPDLGALDYRSNPSIGQVDPASNPAERDAPEAGGRAVGPMPDRTIKSYDLPDELLVYDRMASRS